MKIKIYSNIKIDNFLTQLFPNLDLEFINLKKLLNKNNISEGCIIFFDKNKNKDFHFDNINKDFLLVTNLNINKNVFNKNITLLKTPLEINKIRNSIKKYISKISVSFENIHILEKKIYNTETKLSCLLTDIECEILISLINKKSCDKEYIKTNILKIKTNIETNSLDSHLTRIRKKLEKIKTDVKIKSKNDVLSIFSN